MSETELEETSPPPRKLWPWVVASLLVVLGVFFFFPKPKVQTPRGDGVPGKAEDSLGQARQALTRETDLNTCRSALQQINNHLTQSPKQAPRLPALPVEDLKKLLDLEDSELAEIEGGSFTLLDGRYLEQGFLLRDAAQSLQMGEGFAPLDRATAGFRWAMRQIRLEEHNAPTAPPGYALRRGWGTPLERSLAFLELLRQLGPAEELQGCLVYCPDKEGSPRLWACGVAVEGRPALYLFDPRMGQPIPGPDGKGVATLGQVCKSPSVLAQLTVSDKEPYDATPEQAAKAELRQLCPLSALAPRMKVLQDELLGPNCQVRLAVDARADRERLAKAAASELGKEDAVRAWQETTPGGTRNGAGLQRRFLPPEEGGSDQPRPGQPGKEYLFYQSVYRWTTIPWPFDDQVRFPPTHELGQRVHQAFFRPLRESIDNPERPRTRILRGTFQKAAEELTEELNTLRNVREQPLDIAELNRDLLEWQKKMFQLYGEQKQAARSNPVQLESINQQIKEGWGNARALVRLLAAATARPRSAYLRYQLALCKHDQAEIQQAQFELQNRGRAVPRDPETARAWEDALTHWNIFVDEYPTDPARGAARQLRARALEKMGRVQEAIAAWEDISPPLRPLEKVAGLYQARELRERK